MARERENPSVLDAGTAVYQIAVGDNDLMCMFIHLLRCRAVFLEARAQLQVQLFDRVREPHWAILWATMLDLDKQYGSWTYESLSHAISVRQRQDPAAMPPAYWDALLHPTEQGVTYSIFCVRAEELMPDYGRELVRKFLCERTVIQPLTRHMRNNGDAYAENFRLLVAEASQRLSKIDAVRETPQAIGMPRIGDALPPPIPKIPTGLLYFDRHIMGRRRGDCNGILGVRGSGKTTLGIHLAVTEARNAYLRTLNGGRPELSVFGSYEEPETKLIRRCWSNAALIPSDKLDELEDWSTLTTSANLADYERSMFAVQSPDQLVKGERERYEEAMHWFNRHFVFLDMSCSERFPNAGRGGVDEIVHVLNRLRDERNMDIGSLVVDYAGLVCRRYMSANNIPPDNIRHYLGPMGDRLRREVAIPYNATCWLMHQMASDQGKRSATTKMTDLDAAEAHNFAENLAACACLGIADPRTGCQLINWSKVRYRKQWEHAPSVIMLDGQYCRFNDVSDRYRVDTVTRSFMNPSEHTAIHGTDGPIGTPIGIGSVSAEPGLDM